ncbi:Alpha/beta hydrolase family protein [Streptoalloteichus tenebrarius]|uniref:Alpha/beta hydrolase family protein n=1 Tax=Streptoalloteichus tenebrarius (strain ATCC 17920 / DSM 40477 / JCM 4838 / CBS 697.72 / NBRC 16177 / NCIMB 11028 / NRRL B-12390 / A12253. 1 / ISP 5477) TaxID=1933 RepID=A0ABT1HPR7_STRSD|nr:alpha/beta hydrolase [Streptoalloteichus tenebrarius]MCP2257509.1 Alpha/beta hydrolase family protein [Streptoalloteichus tenebrarius]BFE98459.1 alpha/beta hydrolase [Streptoalloteichus tenebrarius]
MLLHGRGRDQRDWSGLVPLLRDAGLRPVTMDLRGHGGSSPAPWGWDEGLAAVVTHLELARPAVVGHSLGGMVAALWAREHPECPLAVNVDGHGDPQGPRSYDAPDPDAAAAAHEAVTAFLAELDAEDGPNPDLEQYLATFEGFDLFAVYREARCPLLVISSEREEDEDEEELPPAVADAFAAHRRGIARDLALVAAQNPLVSATSLPTTHDVHLEDPEGLVRLVLDALHRSA